MRRKIELKLKLSVSNECPAHAIHIMEQRIVQCIEMTILFTTHFFCTKTVQGSPSHPAVPSLAFLGRGASLGIIMESGS